MLKVLAYTFLGGELFCNFFDGSKSASNSAFYDSIIEFLPTIFLLISALVAIFEAKVAGDGSKN
jgi:hypothetical protein